MKMFLTAVAAAAALAAVAGQAQAATSPEQRIAALEQQVATLAHALAARPLAAPDPRVATLQKKEAALEKRVKKLETDFKTLASGVGLSLVYSTCIAAATADAFTGTWNVVDQLATATQAGKVYFGPQAAVSDFQTCSALQIVRQQGVVPPTVAVFSALTALIGARR
jgi:hypothetical protein